MITLTPSDLKTRNIVVAAIGANKIVGWSFNAGILVYQGTTFKAFGRGSAADAPSLTGYADYLVQGGTSGFAATAGVNSTDIADDTLAAAQAASLS